MAATCTDTASWNDGRGRGCSVFAMSYCRAGGFRIGADWASGAAYNFPERNCCECGKAGWSTGGTVEVSGGGQSPGLEGAAPFSTNTPGGGLLAIKSGALPDAPPPTFSMQKKRFCRAADHEVRTSTIAKCEAQCEKTHCACFHFSRGICRFTLHFSGVAKSGEGFDAYVRNSVFEAPAVSMSSPETQSPQPQGVPGVISVPRCGGAPPWKPPKFYMYDDETFDWAERLTRCYEAKAGMPPWAFAVNESMKAKGGIPPAQLAHGLWLHETLKVHRNRVTKPEDAALFVVPALGSLSEAATSCEGTTHLSRMAAAASSLSASSWFTSAPNRHVILASSLPEDRNVLGALGDLTGRAGAVALCVDQQKCAPGFKKRVELAPLPLPPLLSPTLHSKLSLQACSKTAGKRRKISVFFRGAHAHSHDELRARLWALRSIPGAEIKFTQNGPPTLQPSVRTWLKGHGWSKDVRVPYNQLSYASSASKSDFCVVIAGDDRSAGRTMVDSAAAGCVPLIIGAVELPFTKLLRYDHFSVRVPEDEFMRYPTETTRRVLDENAPRLAELRAALTIARDGLVLAYGAAPLPGNISLASGSDLALLEIGRVICPRSPSTLKACLPQAGDGNFI